MLILLSLVVALLLSFAACQLLPVFSFLELVATLVAMISGILLFAAVTVLPLEHMAVHAKIHEIEAIQQTIERARADGGRTMESAAFQLRVSEANEWLAKKQYYRQTVFALWVPAAVDDLEPIE